MIFCNSSLLSHVEMIREGRKQQITIPLRNLRTRRGEVIDCEYMKNGNTAVLGKVLVTTVIRFHGNLIFSRLRDTIKESWAEREGFSSFLEADEYFSRFYGSDWQVKEYACVKFVLQDN